jgi:hypothetical protein
MGRTALFVAAAPGCTFAQPGLRNGPPAPPRGDSRSAAATIGFAQSGERRKSFGATMRRFSILKIGVGAGANP